MTQGPLAAFQGENARFGVVKADGEVFGCGVKGENAHGGIVSENLDPTRAVRVDIQTYRLVVFRQKIRKTISPFDEGDERRCEVIGEAQLFGFVGVGESVEVEVCDRRVGRVDLGDGVGRAGDEGSTERPEESPRKGRLPGTERPLEGYDVSGPGVPGNSCAEGLGIFSGGAENGQRTGPPNAKY